MRRAPVLIATAAASVLMLAACGGDDEATTSSATSSSMPSSSTAEATPPPAADSTASTDTITDIVAGNPEFSTLLAAVEAAGLAETLSGDGPFTVFAPTDAAFAELPAGTLDTLLQPQNKDQLTAILTYHVVPAEVTAADVKPGQVPTVNSAPFTVAIDGQAVEITDGQGNQANVTETDIDASNGVIHVIDAVLLPAEA
jgi:uncharacterized surface protein with fasciclin (FAS1) repeats